MQIVLISGETGSGKTTQVFNMLLVVFLNHFYSKFKMVIPRTDAHALLLTGPRISWYQSFLVPCYYRVSEITEPKICLP